jgi:thiamine-phosphate pyrophosphorylase
MNETAVYRILDAALNRAAEGLRTIEEWARFAINDAVSSENVKRLRHELTAATGELDRSKLLASRDTINDCGTQISVAGEMERQSGGDVVTAASSRVQQSLRCLEEYGKLVSKNMSARIEQLRYQTYTLEKTLVLATVRRHRIQRAKLYVLVDLSGEPSAWLRRLEVLATRGADVIQIRDKHADDRTLYARCLLAANMFRGLGSRDGDRQRCQLIINDRADIAAAVGADGVHVGQEELPIEAVRKIIGEDKIVGLSTHSLEQATEAIELGADYIGCGPTFPSLTKPFETYVGTGLAEQASRKFAIPVFAIGGINETNLKSLVDLGVSRVAVSGVIWGREDEAIACERLSRQLNS